MKNERMEIIEAITAPNPRNPINKEKEFLLRTKFTITKKAREAKRNGTNAISESNLFTAKRLERKALKTRRISGRSKMVLFSLTDRSTSILRARITSAIRITAAVKICLGSIKKSVVRFTKRTGRLRNRINNKRIEILFR